MKNALLFLLLSLLPLACVSTPSDHATTIANTRTTWTIHPAPGLDALLLIGIVSGDQLQQRVYADDMDTLRGLFSNDTITAVEMLGSQVREMGLLLGPSLTLVGSGGDFSTLDATIESFENPGRLRKSLESTPYWGESYWGSFEAALPTILNALIDLREGGFEQWYSASVLPEVEKNIETLQGATEGVDVIAEQERLLDRTLDPEIEIFLVAYSKPYGIKIQGQRFLNWWGYEPSNYLRTAAHEIFHPPVDFDDSGVVDAVMIVGSDPLIRSILDNHDPKYGYNSLEGIVDEDSAQALDQVVSERLRFGRDPGDRWRASDGGMHLLAAAIYQAMIDTGFAEHGGRYEAWFVEAVDHGLLTGAPLRQRARAVVGEEAVNRWLEDDQEVQQEAREPDELP